MINNKIKEIEEELNRNGIISKKTRADLYHTLEETSHTVERLRSLSDSFNEFSQFQFSTRLCAMEEKIIYLYGKINDLFVASELAKIIQEAQGMQKSMEEKDFSLIAKKAHLLRMHMKTLGERFCLSKQERQELAAAQQVLQKAKEFLQGKHGKGSISHAFPYFEEEDLEEWAIALWEIADLLHHGKLDDGMSKLRRLPESLHKVVQDHMAHAPAKEPELKTIQALIATSYELTNAENNNSYLSAKEIKKVFAELDLIRAG